MEVKWEVHLRSKFIHISSLSNNYECFKWKLSYFNDAAKAKYYQRCLTKKKCRMMKTVWRFWSSSWSFCCQERNGHSLHSYMVSLYTGHAENVNKKQNLKHCPAVSLSHYYLHARNTHDMNFIWSIALTIALNHL